MKIFFALFFLLAIFLAAYPFLDQSEKTETLSGLPWQIEISADGSSKVFGLHIGRSRLADAIEILGDDFELAIIAASEETGSLEMYYGHYKAGLLSGKLVLLTDIDEQALKSWRNNAVKSEYMATGKAKKYALSEDDMPRVLDEVITGVTFIPAVNLDEEVILARFGTPENRVQSAGVVHYLYPDKGLDIALHESAKEVLQYVEPHAFDKLLQPLQ
ncbi:MAG: hypothetical protein KJN89_04620 [Gammaproteobacteria bacterium]|nr:hypothetical protein [Gammaproteobacteria bacterium]NNJ49637.1 hypothetical protein [Gammaproteobacteria bacterium]